MLDIKRVIASAPRRPEDIELRPLTTPWSKDAVIGLEGGSGHARSQSGSNHPHPQFRREEFHLLDGWWNYRFVFADDASVAWRTAPIPSEWSGLIRVPFSPEAHLSEVNRQLKPNELLWYRRSFSCPPALFASADTCTEQEQTKNRCILHFEAVDYACACYCNGVQAGTHIGGYLPFSFDITDMLLQGENEITLCVYDPSDEGVQLRGKQKLERGGIWYTAQSGIWQTVWLEVIPEDHIEALTIDAQPDAGKLELTVAVSNCLDAITLSHLPPPLVATLFDGEEIVCTASSVAGKKVTTFPATVMGSVEERKADASFLGHPLFIHTLTFDVADPHLWSPDDPHLYHLELTYGYDTISSYCAFRTVTMERDEHGVSRLCINHEPCFLRGVLDQGYWPDSLMTAPTDDALIFDIEAMKSLGFNMLRKHIKIESDRWYYHCDRLGMLVWQDMVCGGSPLKPWYTSRKPTFFRWSWGHYDDSSRHYRNLSSEHNAFRAEWTRTCADTVSYLGNHPSIITWVLFNEAWGQFDARAATDMVRTLDPTRPIDAVSGWYDQTCGDFLSVHNYFRPLEVYEDSMQPGRAFVLSEFGGLTYHIPEHSSLASSYGYESYSDSASYRTAVRDVLARADSLEQQGLAGFVYTQLSDVEEETNGLVTYDRRIEKLSKRDSI